MGDPGLASKFVEMQQADAFAPKEKSEIVNSYVRGLMMDRSRILAELKKATHPNHVAILRLSLATVEGKLKP